MGRFRAVLLLGLLLLCAGTLFWALRNWAGAGAAAVREVPPGHQEVAWISPSTSGDAWERMVAALELLQKDAGAATPEGAGTPALGKSLRVNLDNAFLPLTADVPEVALYFDEAPAVKLWIRWYKLSGENPSRSWFEKLRRRARPPLAVIGGETTDRALYQTRALQELRADWPGPAPLYVITTATAERYDPRDFQTGEVPHSTWPKLMEVYGRRTFRFCFTNTRMVEAVLDFVRQNLQLPAPRLTDPQLFAGMVTQGTPLGSLGMLSATGRLQPYFLSTLIWADDGYSKDLGEIFLQEFADTARRTNAPFSEFYNNYIHYSVGDFLEPNPQEALAVGLYLARDQRLRDQPQLLALPTGAQRARRFLRALCRQAPMEARHVVVVTGDGIAFNTVYRDRDLAWNIQDMPVPLVFFSHRNPVDAAAGFGRVDSTGQVASTGTQDVLLNRDIAEALVLAAFDGNRLVADADQLRDRLRHTRWRKGRIQNGPDAPDAPRGVPFFDAAGNRRSDTGEHVLWLRPAFAGSRNLPEAFLTIWHAGGERPDRAWRTLGPPLHILYDQPNQEEGSVHGP